MILTDYRYVNDYTSDSVLANSQIITLVGMADYWQTHNLILVSITRQLTTDQTCHLNSSIAMKEPVETTNEWLYCFSIIYW